MAFVGCIEGDAPVGAFDVLGVAVVGVLVVPDATPSGF
jgi:hypothetical protein